MILPGKRQAAAANLALFEETSGATFSACGRYRWDLWRLTGNPTVIHYGVINFILLNGSTADAKKNDPTVARLFRRATMWGYGKMTLCNIHAWRATDPNELLKLEDPTGPENNDYIMRHALAADMVVCGWSQHRAAWKRGPHVEAMLRAAGVKLYALGWSKSGAPLHPLYIPYSEEPKLWP